MCVSSASATDTGLRRSINEDSVSVREDLRLFVVADGMGGHAAGEVASLAHVGDSRAYRLRDGQLERLTRDHSWVEEQIRVGALSETAARQHPWRNIVTRALSGSEDLEVDIQEVSLTPSDRLLLCTDGVFTVLSDGQISEVLRRETDLDSLCHALIQGANDGGGPDNMTAVVVQVNAG